MSESTSVTAIFSAMVAGAVVAGMVWYGGLMPASTLPAHEPATEWHFQPATPATAPEPPKRVTDARRDEGRARADMAAWWTERQMMTWWNSRRRTPIAHPPTVPSPTPNVELAKQSWGVDDTPPPEAPHYLDDTSRWPMQHGQVK